MSDDSVVPGEAEVTDEQIHEFIEGGEAPTYRTILEVWKEVLRPARDEMSAKVLPQYAQRIISSYVGISFSDMEVFRDRYYSKILDLAEILDEEIASDPECLHHHTPEEDVEHNREHYFNLILHWQMALLQWEMDWETTDPYAAVEMAAISEVHKMFFGQTGFIQFLDNINFEFTEDDQRLLSSELEEMKAGRRE